MIEPHPHSTPSIEEDPLDSTFVPTVLLVDDEPDLNSTLADILEIKEGYRAFTAVNGHQALEVVREHSISVALLDIRLPDMTGTDLLKAIKAISPDTDCIMATGDSTFESVRVALNLGASQYFRKPFQPDEVIAEMRDLMEKQRLRKENARLLASLRQERATLSEANRHLNLLQTLSRTVSSTLEVNEVLQAVRDSIIGALGYNRCSIYLVDTEKEIIQGQWGTDREGNPLNLSSLEIPLSANRPVARVARGEMSFFLTEDMESYLQAVGEEFREEMRGVHAHAVVPLEAKGRIVGVLSVDNLISGKPITQDDIGKLMPFTSQAAIAIDNARLYRAAKESLTRETEKSGDLLVLWQVAQALSYELNLKRVLETLELKLCPVMGTHHYSIFLYNKNFNDFEPRAGNGVDQELAYHALFSDSTQIGSEVIRHGLRDYPNIQADPATPLGRFAEGNGVQSMLCMPLRVGDEAIGLMAMYYNRPARYSARDEQLLSTLASMAASAIRNAQSYDREKRIAETLQHELLGDPPKRIGPYRIERKYQSALEEARVGGDFYDVIEMPDGRAAILLADVSGKGLKAAVYTAMGKYMFRGLLMDDPSPGVLLGKLNAALYRYTEPGMFITLFYGLLDPKTGIMTYANAGHESPLHYMAEHDFSMTLDTTGVVLGVDPDAIYVEHQIQLMKDDLLLLYTDGLTDARSGDEMLGIEGLQRVLSETIHEKPGSVVEKIHQKALDYASGYLHDDIAMIVVRAEDGPTG